MSRTRTISLGLTVALMVLTLGACGGTAGSTANQNNELKVRSDVYYTGAMLAVIAGVQQGIFAKHDVKVTLNPGTGSATTIQTVNNGSDDIGYADAGTLVQSVGQGLKVKMIAGMVQETPMALFAFKESGIKEPKDLAGKTAGYTAGSAGERIFPAYANAVGLNEKSVTFRNVDIPTRDALFMAKETQFTFGLINTSQPNIESRCNCEVVVLKYSDAGIHILSSGIVANEKVLKERPEVVKRFLAGLAEAVEWTNANPDAAVKAFFALATDSKLKPEVVLAQWKKSWELHGTPANKGQPFGCTTTTDWNSTIKSIEQYGGLTPGKVKPEGVATNKYLPKACKDLAS